MNSRINVEHLRPDRMLVKYIKKISIFHSLGKISYRQKITPTPYSYLAFNLADVGVTTIDDEVFGSIEKFHFDGPKISENIFINYNGVLSRILVEFRASGFYYLFHYPPSKLINKLLNLSEISEEFINSNIASLKNSEEQVRIVEKFLIDKSYRAIPFNEAVEKAIQLFEEHSGNISISEVCGKIHLSDRHFNRTFKRIVGISPKQYSKLLQLHYIIKLMKGKNYGSFQDIAYDAKFYDHAHLNHSFKELTGFTPTEFINSDKHIALKYFTDIFDK
ncbi:MAG: helix-turn-helix domain-containing protein [Chlorobi bacterium]|nr:helix-turn-helix domain-containing protein [Chlorobiota bacterium]